MFINFATGNEHTMKNNTCYHCGNHMVVAEKVFFDKKEFCCTGCKTVYEIFSTNDMMCYYDFETAPGASSQDIKEKYNYLDNDDIQSKLLEFSEGTVAIVSLYIPHIHCSSCIWILENLQKLEKAVITSQVNFLHKKVRITFNAHQTTLKELVQLLAKIGYEPYISLENYQVKKEKTDRSLIYKIAVAFFSFGNIMLLSFPEYFEVNEFWIEKYKNFFRILIFALALPSFFYSASGYYIAAYKSLKAKTLNIDVPIALGIIVMFIRSVVDMLFNLGPGFFDSLTGLVFFMLLGKLFQSKTYDFLSFERDYKSYFPIAITRIKTNGIEEAIPVNTIEKGDRLLIRNQELIPTDGILLSRKAIIDYSFVTGEATPVEKKSGDKIFAGGKQIGNSIEMEVLFSVSQSYLTQLWGNAVFDKKQLQTHTSITNKVSRYFTPLLLSIALIALIAWLFIDNRVAFNVFTAILIVACPCALALSAPFTLGNALRILGNKKLYLKNASVIEQLDKIDTLVFDKTGTITSNKETSITQVGLLSIDEVTLLKNILRNSNHPLSRKLYDYLPPVEKITLMSYKEIAGQGILAEIGDKTLKIGSASFLEIETETLINQTEVYVAINNQVKAQFIFNNQYREGFQLLFQKLNPHYALYILSGDNEGERSYLEKMLPKGVGLHFNKKPEEKLHFIETLQQKGKKVMMIGDGLNDAGALAQSNVGLVISENVNVFSPACDGIVDATRFKNIAGLLEYSKKTIQTIYISFTVSFIYNIVGLYFAISGKLEPIVAAIIMPLSTITIISLVTILTTFYSKKCEG